MTQAERARALVATIRGQTASAGGPPADASGPIHARTCGAHVCAALVATSVAHASALVACDGIGEGPALIEAWSEAERLLEIAIAALDTWQPDRDTRPALATLTRFPTNVTRYALLDARLGLVSSRWSLRSAVIAACLVLRIEEPPGLRARR